MAAEYQTISAEQKWSDHWWRRNTVFSRPSDERSHGTVLIAELKYLQKS
jgi:hypothetical protein